jgi:citrate synthase
MNSWRTAIARTDETSIRIRGYDVTALMQQSTFAGLVFLLHKGRLPTAPEAKLIDALLIGVADPGAGAPSCAASRLVASGNRQSLSAAVAAGVLAIGDEHGGAGAREHDIDRRRCARDRRGYATGRPACSGHRTPAADYGSPRGGAVHDGARRKGRR